MLDVVVGQDNVFADLGFSAEESINLKIRADLMLDLRSYIQKQSWSDQEAANFLAETPDKIECLMSGDIDQFIVDELIFFGVEWE
ncbi:MAG: XRE family transcriptional regulator [Cyanobacteria bacterium P01_G01_bin.54]